MMPGNTGNTDRVLTYIVWRDASHSIAEVSKGDDGLVELHEIGFLFNETPEFVTLAMEWQEDGEASRLWLSIPKVSIVSRVDLSTKSFRKPKPRTKKAPHVPDGFDNS